MGLAEDIQDSITTAFSAIGNIRQTVTYSHPASQVSASMSVTFDADTATITGATSLESEGFAAGDIIAVSGATNEENNQIWIVDAIDGVEITVDETYRSPVDETAGVTIKTVKFHPDSGSIARDSTDYTINAVVTYYSNHEVGVNPNIETNDREIIFAQSELSVEPSEQGIITLESAAYEIRDISEDPASATWTIRARKIS